jgi:hypothetical protein
MAHHSSAKSPMSSPERLVAGVRAWRVRVFGHCTQIIKGMRNFFTINIKKSHQNIKMGEIHAWQMKTCMSQVA